MKRTVKTILLAAVAGALVILPQNAMGQGRGGQRGQGGFGNFDPEQMRQRMMQRYQEQLEASDDEWKVIQPLLEDVMGKQREAMGGRFGGMGMMFRRPGGDRGGDAAQGRRGGPRGDGNPEVDALRAALEDDSTSPAELNAKLKALRDSRKKAADDLNKSREKLRAVLTPRQEAMLVLVGTLD